MLSLSPKVVLVTSAAFAAALFFVGPARANDRPDAFDAFETMASDLEASTVALRETSLQFPGSHLRPDSAAYSVEAHIAPSFIALRSQGVLLPGALMLAVTPKVVLRRSDGLPSNPVRTPGYMPSVTLFYAPESARSYFSTTLLHHSNGQTGPFLTPEGRPNHVDGSFSLWSASLTAHLHGGGRFLPDYKALRVERLYLKEGALDAFYPDWIVSLALRTAPRSLGAIPGRARLLADFDWKPRKSSDVPNGLKPAPFSAAITAAWHPLNAGPKTRLDFAVFARAYAGADDYNINFDRNVYRAELGLMFGPLPIGPVPSTSAASSP